MTRQHCSAPFALPKQEIFQKQAKSVSAHGGPTDVSPWGLHYYTPILGYHRIGAARQDHVPTVSPEAFERQLACLARHHYRVLSFVELAERLRQGAAMPRHSAVITFDDGYEETHRLAWPLLKQFGFSAIVFVNPGEIGFPGFATWEQLAQMAREGMLIGNHTMHHRYVPSLKAGELITELVDSKRVIEQRVGRAVDIFSYPIGGFTRPAQEVIREAGYLAACTTNRAWSRWELDRFALRRVKVTERDRSPWLFRAKLSGYYDLFRQLKPPA